MSVSSTAYMYAIFFLDRMGYVSALDEMVKEGE